MGVINAGPYDSGKYETSREIKGRPVATTQACELGITEVSKNNKAIRMIIRMIDHLAFSFQGPCSLPSARKHWL